MSPVSLEGILHTSRLFPLNQPSLSRVKGSWSGISGFFLEINQQKVTKDVSTQKRSDTKTLWIWCYQRMAFTQKSAFGTFNLGDVKTENLDGTNNQPVVIGKRGSIKLPKHFFFGGGLIKFAAIFLWWFWGSHVFPLNFIVSWVGLVSYQWHHWTTWTSWTNLLPDRWVFVVRDLAFTDLDLDGNEVPPMVS